MSGLTAGWIGAHVCSKDRLALEVGSVLSHSRSAPFLGTARPVRPGRLGGMTKHHLAQLNIGRLHAPIDSPEIAEFKNALDTINALAESSPGFVWRLKDDIQNNATGLAFTDDPLLIPNLSLWASVDELSDFVYRSAHTPFLRRRREWFEKMEVFMVLWWVPVGHIPTVPEALERLGELNRNGAGPTAFTFRQRFNQDGLVLSATDRLEGRAATGQPN